ncbi:MAG: DNA replication/repair protein RecF [Clostridiales Family XIII bacterium]|jgi:DNA replication and repair protein RecF|nr:DNA replication/repair protein RecF [Clostridiales Family XIII bacterium]
MYIRTLALQNFRNYEACSVDFGRGVNILTGKNGEGKTNMLEAVHILSMGRSFRTRNDAEAITFGKTFYRIKGLFGKGDEDMTVEVSMNGRDKSFFVDGVGVRKGADLAGHALTVIFSPDDLRIVKDEPEKRRRFMDHELFQLKPLYYLDVIKYRRIVKNRNLLLKEQTLNEPLLNVYDGYLADTGARIMAERARFAEKLAVISAGIQSRITATSTDEEGALEVSYEPSVAFTAIEDARERIAAELQSRRAKDREFGATTAGPHKDDLKLVSGGVDLRKYGSQGQQRTAALALKLAEVDIIKEETGEMPILLLDDVLSELDEGRQKRLPDSFEDCQIIITTADPPEILTEAFPEACHREISSS